MKKMAIEILTVALMLFALSLNAQAQLINGWVEGDVFIIETIPWSDEVDPIGLTIDDGEGRQYAFAHKKSCKKYTQAKWVEGEYSNALPGEKMYYEVPIPASGCINYQAFQQDLGKLYEGTLHIALRPKVRTAFYARDPKMIMRVIRLLNRVCNVPSMADATADYYNKSAIEFGTFCVEEPPVCIIDENCDWASGENEANCPIDCLPPEELCKITDITVISSETIEITVAPGYGINGPSLHDRTPMDNGWVDHELVDGKLTVTCDPGQLFRWSIYEIDTDPRQYEDPFQSCGDKWPRNIKEFVENDPGSRGFFYQF